MDFFARIVGIGGLLAEVKDFLTKAELLVFAVLFALAAVFVYSIRIPFFDRMKIIVATALLCIAFVFVGEWDGTIRQSRRDVSKSLQAVIDARDEEIAERKRQSDANEKALATQTKMREDAEKQSEGLQSVIDDFLAANNEAQNVPVNQSATERVVRVCTVDSDFIGSVRKLDATGNKSGR